MGSAERRGYQTRTFQTSRDFRSRGSNFGEGEEGGGSEVKEKSSEDKSLGGTPSKCWWHRGISREPKMRGIIGNTVERQTNGPSRSDVNRF